jgi:hypothetical protein
MFGGHLASFGKIAVAAGCLGYLSYFVNTFYVVFFPR